MIPGIKGFTGFCESIGLLKSINPEIIKIPIPKEKKVIIDIYSVL
jgi:hypothetical protein